MTALQNLNSRERGRYIQPQGTRNSEIAMEMVSRMLKLPLLICLVILAALLACGEQTPTQGGAVATVPATAEGPTSLPSPVTPAAEPTATPQATPTATSGPGAATTPLPANTPAPEATFETTPAPREESPNKAITPLMLDDPETLASERLGRILYGTEESTPEELNAILGCLQDETLLRLLLSGFVQDPAPLSMETSACIRTGFEKIDLRGAMLATVLGNELDKMMVASIFATIACLNDEEWETAATVLGVDLGIRAAMMCLLEEMGGTAGLTAALEPGAEESFTALILAVTDCDLGMEGGTEPATTLVITIAPIPAEIPEYDRSDWRHWTDEDGDCQDARQEVLIAESRDQVTFETDRQCRVATGRWWAPHLGHHLGNPSQIDVDHHVPLKNAHLSSGWAWSPAEKERYANYLGEETHLVAISSRHNRSKGARGPEEWAPPDNALWCDYATDWAQVKQQWELTMTPVESEIVMDMIGTCEDPPEYAVETLDYLGTVAGEDKPTPGPEDGVYGSCEEAAVAGEQRVQGSRGGGRGFPKAMVPSARDGDGDGVVCER